MLVLPLVLLDRRVHLKCNVRAWFSVFETGLTDGFANKTIVSSAIVTKPSMRPGQMILRNALIEPKLIEQSPLLATFAHHRRFHRDPRSFRNHWFGDVLKPFSQHHPRASFHTAEKQRAFRRQPRPRYGVIGHCGLAFAAAFGASVTSFPLRFCVTPHRTLSF